MTVGRVGFNGSGVPAYPWGLRREGVCLKETTALGIVPPMEYL